MLAATTNEHSLEGLLVCLIIVAVVGAFIYFGCRLAGRPDIGSIAAVFVVVIGGLLCLF